MSYMKSYTSLLFVLLSGSGCRWYRLPWLIGTQKHWFFFFFQYFLDMNSVFLWNDGAHSAPSTSVWIWRVSAWFLQRHRVSIWCFNISKVCFAVFLRRIRECDRFFNFHNNYVSIQDYTAVHISFPGFGNGTKWGLEDCFSSLLMELMFGFLQFLWVAIDENLSSSIRKLLLLIVVCLSILTISRIRLWHHVNDETFYWVLLLILLQRLDKSISLLLQWVLSNFSCSSFWQVNRKLGQKESVAYFCNWTVRGSEMHR